LNLEKAQKHIEANVDCAQFVQLIKSSLDLRKTKLNFETLTGSEK
jgi:hypothetical protein